MANVRMSNVRIPGVAWAILIIVIVASVHSAESYIVTTFGIEPWVIDLILAILIGVLKSLSLSGDQLTQALDVIQKIMSYEVERQQIENHNEAIAKAPPEGMRSAQVGPIEPPSLNLLEVAEEVPERPSKFAQWLVG